MPGSNLPTPSAEPEDDVIERMAKTFIDHQFGEGSWDGIEWTNGQATRLAAMRAALSASGLLALREALRLLMAEVVADPKRLPYPIWGPGQSQRVSVALIAANTALSNPLKAD